MADAQPIPDDVAAGILADAAQALPDEACGVLLGTVSDGTVRIRAYRGVPNDAARAATAFAIPADRVRALQQEAEASGADVVGFWHSHPQGPGAPSSTDLEGALPGYLYVIVDVRTGMLTTWRLRDDRRAFEPADP